MADQCAECSRNATAQTIDGKLLLCWQHTKVALRKAAEAAKEAAYWKRKFAPKAGEPWRGDPEWQLAVREMLDDDDHGNDGEALVRRMNATYRRHAIEARYRAAG